MTKRQKQAKTKTRKKVTFRNMSPVRKADLSAPNSDLAELFQQARRYLDDEQPEKSIEVLVPFLNKIGSGDCDRYLYLHRLLASAYTKTNRFDEAEQCAEKGFTLCPDGLDFLFLLAICSAKKREFNRTIEFSRKYLELWDKKKFSSPKTGPWDGTFGLRHQVLTAYGIALIESAQPQEAEQSFREAIEFQPNYDSGYINLSLLLNSLGRIEEALQVAQRGVAAVPKSMDLRRVAMLVNKKTTISACMIVKNEEELLPRCLKSIRDLVDEIILVDTGSEDRTVQIAEEFGCKIYHFPWQGDFSSARNESLKHATKDWIFIIDADEELPPEEIVKTKFFTAQTDAKVISISVYNKSLQTGKVSSFLPSIRLFRSELGLYYKDIVHNRLVVPPGTQSLRCNIRLFHYGYDLSREKLDKKIARSRALLEKQLEENPDDVFANFNMAQLLFGYGIHHDKEIFELIREHAGRVIRNPESRTPQYFGQYLMALLQKAMALTSLQQYKEAEELCFEALKEKPDYLDALMTLGHIYLDTNQNEKAREYYHRYLDTQRVYKTEDEVQNIIMRHLDGQYLAWYALGVIAHRENKISEAIDAFRSVVDRGIPFRDTYCRLGKLYLDKGEFNKAEEMFKKELEVNENSIKAYFGLGETISARGDEITALKYFQQAAELDASNPHLQLRVGQAMMKLGRREKALTCLKTLLQIVPREPNISCEAGDFAFEVGEIDSAIFFYNQALCACPSHVKALNNLGNCYVRTKQYQKACSIYEQLLEISPNYLLAYRNLGVAYVRLGQREKALKSLMKYSEKKPEDYEVYLIIGDLFSAIGYFSEAIGCYEKYLGHSPQDHICILHLSEAYLNLGFTDSAMVGLKRVLEIDPTCKEAQERLQSLTSLVTV